MTSRVWKPSPNAADARRQRYARAHENAQRGTGDSRTQSHTYEVERGRVQSSPQRKGGSLLRQWVQRLVLVA